MMRRGLSVRLLAAVFAILLAGGSAAVVQFTVFKAMTITAIFATATAIYPGDDVRVSGVKVGTVESIEPQGAQTRLVMRVDHGTPIPADAKAVLVAQNLVAARYIQLAPAYRVTGPTMPDGAVIPLERTAVPVEWDEVKTQLTRLATELGPKGDVSSTSMGRFIDSAAGALDNGNAERLRQTLTELSGVGRIIAEGSPDIVAVIKNFQTFVSALRDSSDQIVQFQDRFATLTNVLDGSRSDLDAALTNVSEVVGQVSRFVANSRGPTAEQVQRLANITQVLVDHQKDLEQVLHVAPTAISNMYNMFDPRTGGASGVFAVSNFADPVFFLCAQIAAAANATAHETGKLCEQYLGPGLRRLNFNQLPINFNPLLNAMPPPDDMVYSEPGLAPGGAGASPGVPETPPAVSAYSGAGDVAPAPGSVPPAPDYATPPAGLPALLLPSSAPDAPLPAEAPAPPPAVPVPTEGTPPA